MLAVWCFANLGVYASTFEPARPNTIAFAPVEAKYVRLVVTGAGENPCIDELEIYAAEGKENLALASAGGQATASSCITGHAAHKIAHLNDGKYGNGNSWIPAGITGEWAQIELAQPAKVARVIWSRDRQGRFGDRVPQVIEVRISADAKSWKTVANLGKPGQDAVAPATVALPATQDVPHDVMLKIAFAEEAASMRRVDRSDPLTRVFRLTEQMLERLAAKGLDVSAERTALAALHQRRAALTGLADVEAGNKLYHDARLLKRELMFRDPDLAALEKILFTRRHPYLPSHNYSDFLDGRFNEGGGIATLSIPRSKGRLQTAQAKVATLFDGSAGMARDVTLDFDAKRVYFAYRPKRAVKDLPGQTGYWHLYSMNADGTDLKLLTDGRYHDYYPCVLPDGGLSFVSTRCNARFLCWVPMSVVLFRMDNDDSKTIRPLSYANLSEWGPSVAPDGRILWTRSEYLDKGADYGHTLWAIRPDGTGPELVYGNNSNFNLMNGRQLPGSEEILATLISHFGDFNGPIAVIDPHKGRYAREAATVITPDHTATSNGGRFRDPFPVSRDYYLVSHNPQQQFGLYIIDRWGNREILYIEGNIGSMCPVPLRATPRPPVLATSIANVPADTPARLTVTDVYAGLGPRVKRGTVKYLRVCEEVRSPLEKRPDGTFIESYMDFTNHYAAPNDYPIWPSYVAKAVLGTVPVEEDGSAYFEVPPGKTFYFQALDQDYNEVQRMRSVMQMQPGEVRGCVGCHDDRRSASPVTGARQALRRAPSKLQSPPWGAGPFSYEKVVQPVLDARCVSCHSPERPNKIDLTGALDKRRVPRSYDGLLRGNYVNYFNLNWHLGHHKAEALTFGTVKSKLFTVLADANHAEVKLTSEQMQALKCWVDLNVPLWPDYIHRSKRPAQVCAPAKN